MTAADCRESQAKTQEGFQAKTQAKKCSIEFPPSFPFVETCLLFDECATLGPCTDCYTEDTECSVFCSAPVEGMLSDNLGRIV